jgi:hypothetical protein
MILKVLVPHEMRTKIPYFKKKKKLNVVRYIVCGNIFINKPLISSIFHNAMVYSIDGL